MPLCLAAGLSLGSGIAHKLHVILGKHLTPCFLICSRPPNNSAGYVLQIINWLRWKPGLSYFSMAEASLKSHISVV